jgi:hypothetical protein
MTVSLRGICPMWCVVRGGPPYPRRGRSADDPLGDRKIDDPAGSGCVFAPGAAPLRPLLRDRRLPVWPGNHVTFGFDRTPRRGGQSRDGVGWVYADTYGALSARRVWQGRNSSRVSVVRPILSG